MSVPVAVLDILLVTPDGTEHAVGEARPYGNSDWDVTWYIGAFEEYVSKALGKYDVAEMPLRFRRVGDRS